MSLRDRLLEPVWLGHALRRAKELPAERAESVRKLGLAAVHRARAAAALTDERHDVAALGLEREAAALAISALLTERGDHDGSALEPAEAWRRLATPPPRAPRELGAAQEVLAAEDALSLERLDARRARMARARTTKVVGWLLRALEVRSPAEIRLARWLRTTAAVLIVAGGLPAAIWWIRRPPNVALFHPVAASSQRPGSLKFDVLTDGSSRGKPAMTRDEPSPWVRVDLLDDVRLVGVVVHAPPQPPPTMFPLVLEVSDDDRQFTEIATWKGPGPEWRIGLAGRRGRYVKLRHPGTGMLSLTEIEVFGRK